MACKDLEASGQKGLQVPGKISENHIYVVELLNSNDKEKNVTGTQELKTSCLPNIKIVQLAPDFLKNTKCQQSTENNHSI